MLCSSGFLSPALYLLRFGSIPTNDVLPNDHRLSASDAKYYHSFRSPQARHRFLLSRYLMEHVFATYYRLPDSLALLRKTPRGAPFLLGSRLVFSLSHCDTYAALLVGECPTLVGVDAEGCVWNEDFIDVARYYFLPGEVRAMEAFAQQHAQRLFFVFWTIKEAVCKALGWEISSSLNSVEIVIENGRLVGVKIDPRLASADLSITLTQLPGKTPVTLAVASSHQFRLDPLKVVMMNTRSDATCRLGALDVVTARALEIDDLATERLNLIRTD